MVLKKRNLQVEDYLPLCSKSSDIGVSPLKDYENQVQESFSEWKVVVMTSFENISHSDKAESGMDLKPVDRL